MSLTLQPYKCWSSSLGFLTYDGPRLIRFYSSHLASHASEHAYKTRNKKKQNILKNSSQARELNRETHNTDNRNK